jgi:hypothetical protein
MSTIHSVGAHLGSHVNQDFGMNGRRLYLENALLVQESKPLADLGERAH